MPTDNITTAASYPIQTYPTWSIMDSTKAKAYMSCPRKFFFEYVLGWRRDTPNIHLGYGHALHEGMEYIYQQPREERFSEETLAKAFSIFTEDYVKEFGDANEEANAPKNMANTFDLFHQYAEHYKHEEVEVLTSGGKPMTEIAGEVYISDKYTMHFKIDMVAETPEGITIIDHKTTGADRQMYIDAWTTDFQPSLYTHAIRSLFHGAGVHVHGMIMNILIIRKKGNAFRRKAVVLGDEMMVQWYWEAERLMQEIEREFEALSQCKPDHEVMQAFPRKTTSCTSYNTLCAYHAFCCSPQRTNPLQYADEPEIGFKVEHWDPRERAEGANFTLSDGELVETPKGTSIS